MLWARIKDALAIWDRDAHPVPRFCWLRAKASLCIALGWEAHTDAWHHCPVWASRPWNTYGADGPGQSWREISVATDWREWQYSEYTNGF